MLNKFLQSNGEYLIVTGKSSIKRKIGIYMKGILKGIILKFSFYLTWLRKEKFGIL